MHLRKIITILTLAVVLVALGGCDDPVPAENAPIEASGTETVGSDTTPGSEVTLPDDVITAETPTSGESDDPDDTQDAGESEHTHTWVDETRYNTVHHDAVTHTEQVTVTDQAAWDETVTTYTPETQTIHHDEQGHYEEQWVTEEDDFGGYREYPVDIWVVDVPAWDETVTVQVPHTTTVHHDAVTHVETRTVTDKAAYDEQVPYTVTVCSECGKEKE